MTIVTQDKVKKVGPFYRGLSGFFFFCTVLAAFACIYALVTEPFELSLIGLFFIVIVGGHVSGRILFTGFAPWYLLNAHGAKDDH